MQSCAAFAVLHIHYGTLLLLKVPIVILLFLDHAILPRKNGVLQLYHYYLQ